jgi:uncharacterized membrane protein
MELSEILKAEELQIKKLHQLVQASIEEQEVLSHKLLEIENDPKLSLGQKLADRVSSFGGSWQFIISFFLFLILWILYNVLYLRSEAFDPYPFILLNLLLSCIAAIQAPIIMMSQNRQEEKDRHRARSDLMINMKAEIEIRSLHNKMDLLMVEQMQHLFKIQQAQLDLLNKITEKIK